MNSIKSKIIIAFSVIVFIFASLLAFVFVVNYNLTNGYKAINNNIIFEQSLKDDVLSLIGISYNSFNTNDYSQYYTQLYKVKTTEDKLDLIFNSSSVDIETKLAYRSLKNSLTTVLGNVEKTKADLVKNGGIVGISKFYQDTLIQFEYVKKNIDNLLISETKNIAKTTISINSAQDFLTKLTSIIAILTVLLILFLILIFSNSITKPILYLYEVSKKITGGDLNVIIDENIKNKNNEMGHLASAFSLMILKLKEKIAAVDESSKKVLKSNSDLENSNKAILNILEDVEKEKNNAENIASDLEKFKLAVENASDQIIITDVEGIVIYGNKAVYKITGYTAEEAMGKKAGVLWKSPMSTDYYKNLWDIIKNQKKMFISEIQNKRKSGDIYTAAISIFSVLNKDGEIIYFVAIERDITKEKEVDKAKTEFVSLASHQLRTPLSAINWYTEMLLAGDAGAVNDEQKKYLEEIAIGNKRMVDLVDDLLNVSRLDMGTFVIETKPVNLLELIKSVLKESSAMILEKKMIIKESYDEGLSLFLADEKLIRMIFQNLLSNAVKYTPPSGLIKISLLKINKGESFGDKIIDEESLAYSVADSGMGIPTSQQGRIFSKLFRADNAKESETEGTGLGLYVVKSIVDQAGGSLWFKSEENKGSTFYVVFPLSGMKVKEKVKEVV
ncbi:MAG TPA: ATP-binding protein [Candidatus Paceibacterota bacterium]